MANSITKTRTNYVGITDPTQFQRILSACETDDGDKPVIITRKDDGSDKTLYGFYCNGFQGFKINSDEEDCDYDYDAFVSALQQIIEPYDALIITSAWYEERRCVNADATIITRSDVRYISLREESIKAAKEMLDDPSWDTTNEY